jgi:hypothetical protein
MVCSRGRASPDKYTQLRLFADSGGFCQNPSCPAVLFVDVGTERLHIAEMAHVMAAADRGPRAKASLSPEQRGSYENLILLCPTCHTIVDKAPQEFPEKKLLEWKKSHRARITTLFGAVEYQSRSEARQAIIPALAENGAIFRTSGPDNDYRFDPESELADVWKRKVVSTILPNNRKILAIADANRRHLTEVERGVLELFRQHVNDLEHKHLGTDRASLASRFPDGMNTILGETDE